MAWLVFELACVGLAWLGLAWLGLVWLGSVRLGVVRCCVLCVVFGCGWWCVACDLWRVVVFVHFDVVFSLSRSHGVTIRTSPYVLACVVFQRAV